MDNPETRWLELALRGDEDAFCRLMELYQKPVFNLCYRMTGDPQEAEDAAQETFLRAYQNLKRYDPQRSFATWLLSIAAHYCIDQIRRRKALITPLDALPEETHPAGRAAHAAIHTRPARPARPRRRCPPLLVRPLR